jgi:hypothetical protein
VHCRYLHLFIYHNTSTYICLRVGSSVGWQHSLVAPSARSHPSLLARRTSRLPVHEISRRTYPDKEPHPTRSLAGRRTGVGELNQQRALQVVGRVQVRSRVWIDAVDTSTGGTPAMKTTERRPDGRLMKASVSVSRQCATDRRTDRRDARITPAKGWEANAPNDPRTIRQVMFDRLD